VGAEKAGPTEDDGMFAVEFGERAQARAPEVFKGHGFQIAG
jgi:hypothetical protein